MIAHMVRRARMAGAALWILTLPLAAAAQDRNENVSEGTFSPEPLFARGRYEASFTSGVLFSPVLATHDRPTINYTLSSFQLGYMLWDVKGRSWWRGNLELAGEGFGSTIFEGPGDYIVGGTFWMRYNFVPRCTPRLVPFIQGGLGAVSTDIDREYVGQPFNFNLEVSAGARYFVSRNWALSLEFRYQHISNAGMGKHNIGINASGPILGISCFL